MSYRIQIKKKFKTRPSIFKYKIIESSQRNETVQKAWNDICIKSPHPNLLICPKQENKLFFPQDKKAKECTAFLRYFLNMYICTYFEKSPSRTLKIDYFRKEKKKLTKKKKKEKNEGEKKKKESKKNMKTLTKLLKDKGIDKLLILK